MREEKSRQSACRGSCLGRSGVRPFVVGSKKLKHVVCRYIYVVLCVMEDAIVCVFHHGGKFINDSTLKYEGETTTLSFDPDMWSFFVVVSVVKSLGYENFKDLWYCLGGGLVLENRLEQLIDDRGVMHMANLARLNGEVHLYVVHVVSDPEVIHMLEDITNDEGEVEGNGTVQKEGEEDGDSVQVNGEGDGDLQEVNVCEEDGDGVEVNGVVDGDLEEVNEGEEDGGAVEVEVEGHGHVQELHEVEKEQELNVCEEVVEDEVYLCSWSTSTEEGDVHGNNECLEGLIDVSVECDIDGDVDGHVEVEVEVESLYDSDDDRDNVSVKCHDHDDKGLSDLEWKYEENDY
ncbi:hypothetical protein LR48_Vigan05g035500 [Vigna angularis]|uniref:PB1-like domain-containing protein n=1 Tax=Phaseolus angularis TaxID=3914 RepID=A0A0L9UJ80_PHAAN|nr:hypothetical protein LR48_Vigan05g035500 [Vigna angularis]